MEDNLIELEEQIERCRRLAAVLTDEEMRRSLDRLADDYAAKLRRKRAKGEGFMLRSASR